MSMKCRHCGEGFPKGQSYSVFEMKKQQVMPSDAEGQIVSVVLEDGGVFCSRKCLMDNLKAADKSGVFGLGKR